MPVVYLAQSEIIFLDEEEKPPLPLPETSLRFTGILKTKNSTKRLDKFVTMSNSIK
jgi:hypothetical protein